jgi:heat shock protein HslJ
LNQLGAFILFLGVVLPAWGSDQTLRYRGQYSFGHEVNIFCPEINSQCYWLSPDTSQQQRQQLKQLVEENTDKNYEAICVVVEGQINRDPTAKQAIGFAADYDGLFTISRLYGLCGKAKVVTQGDLQHHRWVLESINGDKILAAKLDGKIPELEIGEQMMASGDSGCNRFQGRAALRRDRFIIDPVASTRMFCKPGQNDIELLLLQVFAQESIISIDIDKNLILKTDDNLLIFRLQDRV